MTRVETLLFDLIPTIDFLGLEKGKSFTQNGKILLELADKQKCEFLSPLLLSQNIQPLYTVHKELVKKRGVIYVAKNMPLTLRSKRDFSEEIKAEIIKEMSLVIGLIPYYIDYIDPDRYSHTPVNFYNANTGKIIHTERRKEKPKIISPKEYF